MDKLYSYDLNKKLQLKTFTYIFTFYINYAFAALPNSIGNGYMYKCVSVFTVSAVCVIFSL